MRLQRESAAERTPWRPRDAGLAVLAGLMATTIVLAFLGPDPGVAKLFGLVVPAQTAGSLGVIVWLAPRRTDWRRSLAIGILPDDVVGVLIGASLQLVLSIAAYWVVVVLFGFDPPTQEVVDIAADAVGWGDRALVMGGVILLGPISEELIFRGVLLGALRRTHTDRMSIVVSATAFAVLHLLDPGAAFAVPFLFVLGLVMGRAVVSTGRLGRAVAMHAGFNLVTVVALFSV